MVSRRARLSARYHQAAEPGRPPPDLTSDLLEEILLRVTSPVDLARASTACVAFRRLITDHTFLRQYHSIHPPLLLGFVDCYGFHLVEGPHPSAAVGCIVAQSADFSFDYLPRRPRPWRRWRLCDVCNGRVLMECRCTRGTAYFDLAVCDPLSGQCLLLPPITNDLLASVELQNQNISCHMASFIPSGSMEEDTSFSVILWMQSNTKLGVLVFSSVSGCWSVSMSTNCDVLGLNSIGGLVSGQCIDDRFYWKLYDTSMLIKVDMNTMQFCTFDLPPGHGNRRIVIVESGRNKVAMFSLNYEGTSVDYYTFPQNGSENSHEWHMMSGIPIGPDGKHQVHFSLEIKSFKTERVSTIRFAFGALPYFGFHHLCHQ